MADPSLRESRWDLGKTRDHSPSPSDYLFVRPKTIPFAFAGFLLVVGCGSSGGNDSPDGGVGPDGSTSDTTAPQITTTTPTGDATDVDRATTVTVTFDEPIATATVTSSSFLVEDANGQAVMGSVSANANGAVFTPDNHLIFDGAVYTARVTTAVTDVAGNALVSEYAWSFTTASRAWTDGSAVYTAADTDAETPDLATSGDGHAMVVWLNIDSNTFDERISASRYVPGTGWEAAVNLQSSGITDAGHPTVAMDANGNAIALWTEWSPTGNISSAYYTAGAGWSAAVPVEQQSGSAGRPRVGFDGAGNAIAIFRVTNGSGQITIWANRYVPGTGWGTAQALEAPTIYNSERARLAVSKNGDAFAIWEKANGVNPDDVLASRYDSVNGWGTPEVVDTSADNAAGASIGVDDQGNAIALWHQRDVTANARQMYARRYVPGTGWGAAQQLSGDHGAWGRIGVSANGHAVALFPEQDDLRYSIYDPSTGWSTAASLQNGDDSVSEPHIAVDTAGNATVMWLRANENSGFEDVWAARLDGGTWSAPRLMEADDSDDAFGLNVAIDDNGDSLLVWVDPSYVLSFARFD